jgi:opacity protein-like surface antigen
MIPIVLATALAVFPKWGGAGSSDKETSTPKEQKEGKDNQSIFELTPPCAAKHEEKVCPPSNWAFQVRGAAFISLKKGLRQVYGSGIPTLEFEGSYNLLQDKWTKCDQLLLWGNIGWTAGSGRHTRMDLVPLSLGLEYQIHFAKYFDFYVGIGPTYSFLRINDHHNFHHFNSNRFGFTSKTGFRATFPTNFFIDVFADYYYTQFRKMHMHSIHIDSKFSAFMVGAGFGYKW